MGDLTLTGVDQAVIALLNQRATETGSALEDLAKEALLRGLMWSPAERSSYADRIRAAIDPGAPMDPADSTAIVRQLRDRA